MLTKGIKSSVCGVKDKELKEFQITKIHLNSNGLKKVKLIKIQIFVICNIFLSYLYLAAAARPLPVTFHRGKVFSFTS